MFIFNEVIGHLGLLELPIKGRRYTWSNMQGSPLLEQLDWFFTWSNWISCYPLSQVHPLAKTASDNLPCVVSISTNIPKANIFRFENYWVEQEGFLDCVSESWQIPSHKGHITAQIVHKLKRLRGDLKAWQTHKSGIKTLLLKSNRVVFVLDCLEELKPLTGPEFIIRKILKLHIEKLLHWQSLYWKKRCTKRYIKVGEENSKFF